RLRWRVACRDRHRCRHRGCIGVRARPCGREGRVRHRQRSRRRIRRISGAAGTARLRCPAHGRNGFPGLASLRPLSRPAPGLSSARACASRNLPQSDIRSRDDYAIPGRDPDLRVRLSSSRLGVLQRAGSGDLAELGAVFIARRDFRRQREVDWSSATIDADCAVVIAFDPDPPASLAVTIDDGRDYIRYGMLANYVVTLANEGGGDATAATLTVSLPPQIDAASTTWVCLGAGAGASCTASGSGAPNDTQIDLPAGRSLTWMISAPVEPHA